MIKIERQVSARVGSRAKRDGGVERPRRLPRPFPGLTRDSAPAAGCGMLFVCTCSSVLQTSVSGPCAQDDEWGSRRINPMELYHSHVTRV